MLLTLSYIEVSHLFESVEPSVARFSWVPVSPLWPVESFGLGLMGDLSAQKSYFIPFSYIINRQLLGLMCFNFYEEVHM